jgi:hypothetical protein
MNKDKLEENNKKQDVDEEMGLKDNKKKLVDTRTTQKILDVRE